MIFHLDSDSFVAGITDPRTRFNRAGKVFNVLLKATANQVHAIAADVRIANVFVTGHAAT